MSMFDDRNNGITRNVREVHYTYDKKVGPEMAAAE